MKNKTFIIAEAGVNHNGDIATCYKLIDAAADAKVDAIKFQTWKTELIVSKKTERAEYQRRNMPHKNETQFEMIKRLELKDNDFIVLKKYCDDKGILFLSTTTDFPSTELIAPLVPLFKVSSADLTNYPFLKHLAQKGKPIILSTGMSNLGEIEQALDIIRENQPEIDSSFPEISILHCTTNYPCPMEEVNLNAMVTLKKAFKLQTGYSDHTLGIEVPIAAVSLGATIIEKHFTLDRTMPGPDHRASLEPNELKDMVNAIRNIEIAMGSGIKKPSDSELKNKPIARKSIVAKCKIKQGDVFTIENLAVKRPGNGITPMRWDEIIGRKAIRTFEEDDLIEI